ncbi:MAG: hypothetical protein CL627_12120 [Aurantimonas sp.]|nr:hypothetical protein [Aurantimonas sp.]
MTIRYSQFTNVLKIIDPTTQGAVKLARIIPINGMSNKTERFDGVDPGVAGLVALINEEGIVVYAGTTNDMRRYAGYFTNPTLIPSAGHPDAITHEYVACKVALDGLVVTAYGICFPNKSEAQEVVRSLRDHFGESWPEKRNLLNAYDEEKLARFKGSVIPATALKRTGQGWPSSPNIAHNAEVEQAAINAVRTHFNQDGIDRQADNCGWDLEFSCKGSLVCIEVKGVSGKDPTASVSVNEYTAMRKVMEGEFTQGDYRLAIVTNALVEPVLHMFFHDFDDYWKCELTSRVIRSKERTAAQLG